MEEKECHMKGDLWELMDLGLLIKDFVVFTEGKGISFRGQSHVQTLPFLNKTSSTNFFTLKKFPAQHFNLMKRFLTKNM